MISLDQSWRSESYWPGGGNYRYREDKVVKVEEEGAE